MGVPSIGVGIIGCGHVARAGHAPAYRELNVPLVACADVVPERAERFAREFSVDHWYGNYRDLLDRNDVQAVSVTVPNRFHHPIVMEALACGKHVLCEKPLAVTSKQAGEMVEAARQARRILMVGFQSRFRIDAERLRMMVAEGDAGPIRFARAGYVRHRGSGWGWYSHKDISGGGALIDIGVHALDLACYIMGDFEPNSVNGKTARQFGRYRLAERREWKSADYEDGFDQGDVFTVEDSAMALFHFSEGRTLFLEAAWASNYVEPKDLYVDISGDQGGAHLFPLEWSEVRHGTVSTVKMDLAQNNATRALLAKFLGDVAEGRDRAEINTGEEGYAIQRMIDGIYQSAAQGGATVIMPKG